MTIELFYKYISYDVEQLIDKYVKARIDDTEKKYNANLRTEDACEGDLIRRMAITGCGRLRALLAKYLTTNKEDATNTLGEVSSWEFTFKTTVDADGQMLAGLMHSFVVRSCISAWCAMQGYPNEAEREIAEANRYEQEIKNSIRRTKPTRPDSDGE